MTPSAYSKALARLAKGTVSEAQVATLNAAAGERLRAAGYPENFADALNAYWWDAIERREHEVEAKVIAAAVARLRHAVEVSERWRPYLRLPDAAIWGAAGARAAPNNVTTIGLADYLRGLETYLSSDNPSGITVMWGRVGDSDRRSQLMHFVIRFVAGATPAKADRPDATSGQKRYGRNKYIAHVCSAILAQPIDRQNVAQTLKKTV
jgi:hypothetical protein